MTLAEDCSDQGSNHTKYEPLGNNYVEIALSFRNVQYYENIQQFENKGIFS